MKKIELNKDINDVQHWFETQDGKKLFLPYYYGIHVDLVKMEYTYDESDLPTLNDLCSKKILVVKRPYKEGKVSYQHYPLTINVQSIINKFKKQGFNVTEKAILHNFYAWRCDFKSGYRDEENGYHLFSPCGCNPLSFRVSSLHKACKDWQTTYIC